VDLGRSVKEQEGSKKEDALRHGEDLVEIVDRQTGPSSGGERRFVRGEKSAGTGSNLAQIVLRGARMEDDPSKIPAPRAGNELEHSGERSVIKQALRRGSRLAGADADARDTSVIEIGLSFDDRHLQIGEAYGSFNRTNSPSRKRAALRTGRGRRKEVRKKIRTRMSRHARDPPSR
jgi:hypothetical protein